MMVSQNGDPVVETTLASWNASDFSDAEVREVVVLMLDYFHLEAVRTNATKHCNTEMELREVQ